MKPEERAYLENVVRQIKGMQDDFIELDNKLEENRGVEDEI